jgi:predicted metal-dependent hydrolase
MRTSHSFEAMLPLLRFTLDLFDSAMAPSQPPSAPRDTPVFQGPKPAFVPGELLPQAIDLARFKHPMANREVRLDDAVVGYVFSRAKRRTIGFIVGPEGLVVRAPRWTPLYEVEAALQEKGRWILGKLNETRDRHARASGSRVVWADGVVIPYLGEDLRIVLDPTHGFSGKGAQLLPVDEQIAQGHAVQRVLLVGLPKIATAEQIRDAVQAWLMQEAKANFLDRMNHFSPLLQVRWSKLRLSNAGTRWGSASADGSIRLNWRLIHFRQPVIDYVVAHELSHLRVMNHSRSFWDTVATVVPDYAGLRKQLKTDAIPKW